MSTATATSSTPSNAPASVLPTPGRPPKMSTAGRAIDSQRKPGSPIDGTQRKPPTPKAWGQGTNPIIHRSSHPPAPDGAVTTSKPPHSSPALPGETASPMRHLSDRMMYLLANLTGLPATITLKNGEKYSGVLSGTSLDPSELRYVFKMVKKLLPTGNAHTNGALDSSEDYVGVGDYHVMSFDMSDVADFNVNHVVLDRSQIKGPSVASAFRTDTDISGDITSRERSLQKWEPAEMDPNLSLDPTGPSTEWDQFSANERLFGVRSNYDETLYTTTINKNDPEYAARAARAEKIAREIEASSALNSHVREERGGLPVADDAGDEEDRYSGVRREFPSLASGQANRYTPPARRPPASQSTVPGAPVDPAILSSSLARLDGAASRPTQHNINPAAEKAALPESAELEAANSAQTAALKEAASRSGAKTGMALKPAADTSQKLANSTIKPGSTAAAPRKSGRLDATTNVEHDLLDSFKQFSAAERMRVSERQRAVARETKAVKLNDLKKFALNFKLNTPVPTDLVPILAKDESKQQAIVQKALRQAQETKSTPPKALSAATDPKVTTPRPAAKADPASTPPSANPDRQQNQRPRPGQSAYASATIRESRHSNTNQTTPRDRHGMLSTRLQMNQQQLKQQAALPYNGIPQPIPVQDMRLPPTGPSQPSSGMQTPSSSASTRFNVRAHEFKPNPAAHTFLPGGASSANSSPQPDASSKHEIRKPLATSTFFIDGRPAIKQIDSKTSFNAITRMEKETQASEKSHGPDLPAPYRTPPTWDFPATNTEKSHVQLFELTQSATPLSAPQHPILNGPMPHAHQLPAHLQGPQAPPQGPNPQHTPHNRHVQPLVGQSHGHFEAPHMQFSHSTSSVQPSPRPMPPYMYSGQPQQMPGYPQPVQVPQYGMSPNVQHVTLRNAPGGHFIAPPGPTMGGQMMANQPSNGPYAGMPGNPQMPIYSPAPGPTYSQYPGHMPGPAANGFPSPRPGAPMMSQQGSQQGHMQQPPMVYMQPGAPAPQMYQMQPGSMTPMRGPYAQLHQGQYGSPQQHHHFPHQHRGTPSGSYSQPMMQQHSMGPGGPPTGPANHGPDGSDEVK